VFGFTKSEAEGGIKSPVTEIHRNSKKI